jgi:nucleotide-binding universal stress UspA family protein
MAIRKLMLPLMGTAAGEAALTTALIAARRWRAHLSAVHVRADSRDVAQMVGEGLSGAMIEEMMNATDRESARRAGAVRALFDRFVAEHDVIVAPARPGAVAATASFDMVVGREDDQVAQLARLADMTVVSHPDSGEDISSSDALHAVLFDSGRPVLISPAVAPATLGERVCLAWNGTAESAAAARFAIPWLQQADKAVILSSKDYQRRGPSAEGLAGYLALHDITTTEVRFSAIEREVGKGMLAAAHEAGADMLIMGAYSASRLRQLILGGVTRYILEHADLPVLMCR